MEDTSCQHQKPLTTQKTEVTPIIGKQLAPTTITRQLDGIKLT